MSQPSSIAKYLYLRKIDEIARRSVTGDFYDLIMASALLRHVLVEDFPLMHKANRELKLKLRFKVWRNERPGSSGGLPDTSGMTFYQASIEPMPGLARPVEEVTAQELLKLYCMTFEKHHYTVKDILEHCCYARGGVHLNDTPSERDEGLFQSDHIYTTTSKLFEQYLGIRAEGPPPPPLLALVQIINVVLDGLEPLSIAVAKELGLYRGPETEGSSGEAAPSA